MTDSRMYEFEDIGWDDICQSDDHIVPRTLEDHSPFGDSCKKPHCEGKNIAYNSENRYSAGYVDQGSEEGQLSSLSKRKYRMLERDSRSDTTSGAFSSSTDADSIQHKSSLASEKTTSSSYGHKNGNTDSYGNEFCVDGTIVGVGTTDFKNNSSTDPLGDITHTGNDMNFFENDEVKDSSDLLNFGWPEIENFEDVDRIFRSCDSTFGLGSSKDDEFDWFSSSDNIGDRGELVNSDFKFQSPESKSAQNLSSNHDVFRISHQTRDSSHAHDLLPSVDGSHDRMLPLTDPTGTGKGDKLLNPHGRGSLVDSDVKPANIVMQATSSDPGSMSEEAHYAGIKSVNQSDIVEACHFIPAELGSSNVQESSTSSGMDDVSLEAASFRRLQLVMEKLDLGTKMCIRDSLYRLARSAEQRHIQAKLNSRRGDGGDASRALATEGEKRTFMHIETDTNPIDRSVAHLLFHRPLESSPPSAQDSLPFKSPSMVSF